MNPAKPTGYENTPLAELRLLRGNARRARSDAQATMVRIARELKRRNGGPREVRDGRTRP